MSRARPGIDALEAGVLAGDRSLLARAITLIESRTDADSTLAQSLLTRLLPKTGRARRIGITGVPGVGKSTFIDAFGTFLTARGLSVAVLAIDPTSKISGGSILGDKTRMARLSIDPRAYIRPSPSGETPGGVARRTRETLLLCEAAGFDVVLVETVGVGQGETAVADMVDCFLVLMLPGSGDELQGIKKGILELADLIAVNKSDGDNVDRARLALADLKSALRYLPRKRDAWEPRAIGISGLTGFGLDTLWDAIEAHRRSLVEGGALEHLRAEQALSWTWTLIRERLEHDFRANAGVAAIRASVEADVRAGTLTSTTASEKLLTAFRDTTG